MVKLEELQRGIQVRGIVPQQTITLVSVEQHGSTAVEVIYRRIDGQLGSQLVYRHDEPSPVIVEGERRWSFNADGALLRLVSEANRTDNGEYHV